MIGRTVRSVVAVLAGLVLLSAVVEGVEFALVSLIRGETAPDPVAYFAVRNRGWFLALKLGYNSAAAVGAGYAAAALAGRAAVRHGMALALVQTAAFGWALSQPEMRRWTPVWMWGALMVLSFAGIVWGARRRAARTAQR